MRCPPKLLRALLVVSVLAFSTVLLAQSPRSAPNASSAPQLISVADRSSSASESDSADSAVHDSSSRSLSFGTSPLPVIAPVKPAVRKQKYDWRGAMEQSMFLLMIEHSFRVATEQGTRDELGGPFFADWFESVSHLRGWRDGDPAVVNYIGHPMQGAVTGFIEIQNSPSQKRVELAWTPEYRRSRLKAFLFSAAFETQFEIGPLSESSLGNVGRLPSLKSKHPQSYVDIVITPTVGTAWLVAEDALDRYVTRAVEARTSNRYLIGAARTFLNPARSFANLMRFTKPWHRDSRTPGLYVANESAPQPSTTAAQDGSRQPGSATAVVPARPAGTD